MRILVIDDIQSNLDAAVQTLDGHDVTTCASYDEAVKFLEEKKDEKAYEKIMEEYRRDNVGSLAKFDEAKQKTKLPYWDAVLCDLLMPAGKDAQGEKGMQFVGQELPVGLSLALVAASRGAKYVAVVSQGDHHSSPAIALMDRLNYQRFEINGARVIFTSSPGSVGIKGTEHACARCNGAGCGYCKNGVATKYGKNWGKVLNQLTQGGD